MTYYLRKHWKMNLLVFLMQILWAGLIVYQNVVMIEFVQGIFEADMHRFLFWMSINIILWMGIKFVDAVRSWAKCWVIRAINNDLRGDIVATILQKNHHDFHAQQSGEYLSWFTNDISQIESRAWQSFFGLISVIAQIIFSIIVLAKMHWSLLAASLLAAVVIISAPKLFGKKVEKLSATLTKEQALATSKLKDLLAGLDVLRFFGYTNKFAYANKEASSQMEDPKYKLSVVQTLINELIDIISLLCQFAVVGLVGVLSVKGIIIQSAIMGCGNLCGTIYNGLATVGQLRLSILTAKPYFDKITEHAGKTFSEDSSSVKPLKKYISIDDVSFQYEDKPILQNLSIRFEIGKKYALTGPSGCGKSTLLKLLLGWLPDYTGSIHFDDLDAHNLTTEQLQKQMSYIEQNVFLFNTTIRENITLGESFPDEQLAQALRDSALDGDLASMPLGLDTPVGEEGSCLSGGQKQRVAIARALIHNRSILLVDEGTSALDQKNADLVEKSLLSNPKLTLILVSHHLSPERKVQFDKVFELQPVITSSSESNI